MDLCFQGRKHAVCRAVQVFRVERLGSGTKGSWDIVSSVNKSPHRLESRGLVATWLQPGVFNLTIFQKNPPVAVWEGVLLAGSR